MWIEPNCRKISTILKMSIELNCRKIPTIQVEEWKFGFGPNCKKFLWFEKSKSFDVRWNE